MRVIELDGSLVRPVKAARCMLHLFNLLCQNSGYNTTVSMATTCDNLLRIWKQIAG